MNCVHDLISLSLSRMLHDINIRFKMLEVFLTVMNLISSSYFKAWTPQTIIIIIIISIN